MFFGIDRHRTWSLLSECHIAAEVDRSAWRKRNIAMERSVCLHGNKNSRPGASLHRRRLFTRDSVHATNEFVLFRASEPGRPRPRVQALFCWVRRF
jgi:hypothetical protein